MYMTLLFIFLFNKILVMNILLNIKKYKKEHKFLFAALIASWVPGLCLFILYVFCRHREFGDFNIKHFIECMYFLSSPILVSLISYIACKTMPKYPKLTKWISAILNIGLILYVIFVFFVIFFLVLSFFIMASQGISLFNE